MVVAVVHMSDGTQIRTDEDGVQAIKLGFSREGLYRVVEVRWVGAAVEARRGIRLNVDQIAWIESD